MAGIDSDLIRGHIDTIILKALYHGDKYGLEIIQEIEEKSNGTYELKQPTLYSCLKRLESQGLISSYWKDSEIGGKRHYYKLTEQGLSTYKANQEEWLRSREIIDNLIYNTSIDYAPIYDDDQVKANTATANTVDIDVANEQEENIEDFSNQSLTDNDEQNNTKLDDNNTEPISDIKETEEENVLKNYTYTKQSDINDYQSQDGNDEFALYSDDFNNQTESFFAAKSETSDNDDIKNTNTTTLLNTEYTTNTKADNKEELVDLNLDEIPLKDNNNNLDLSSENLEEENTKYQDITNNEIVDISTNLSDEDLNDTTTDSEDIYSLKNDSIANDADDIYNPNAFNEDEIYSQNTTESYTPTYIKFENENKQEADLTSLSTFEEDTNIQDSNLTSYTDNIASEDYNQDNTYSSNQSLNNLELDSSIQDTATKINEKYYNNIPHASEEEINNLYKTTENYENLQAGYTDETYKQMLSELESYSSSPTTEESVKKPGTVLTLAELTEQFEADGIVVRKHIKQIKESDDSKMYVKTNQIHLVKNWITFGITTLFLLLTFGIMTAFKSSYTYNFAFWQFIVAIAVGLIIPIYSTIKYLINPYKKVVAKYAPRLSILLSVLITIQLILIIYCVNLQLGFYSFKQENYCHLIWILPLILSFTPIIQSLVYMPLYNSKKYHI